MRRVRELARDRGEAVTQTIRTLVDREWQAGEAEKERRLAEHLRVMHAIQDEVRRKLPPEMFEGTLKDALDSIYDVDGPDVSSR